VKAIRSNQRGAALLMAMLTVALVATLAAASLWQQWRSVEVESAERARVQTTWVLTGALDWGRLILREDARARGNNAIDHLGEPWAVPLQESRLSTFLAADREHVVSDDGGDDAANAAFLSGQIIDAQSRMNVMNLIDGAKLSETQMANFERLFSSLNLPVGELTLMAENLRQAKMASVTTSSTGAPAAAASAASAGSATADASNSSTAPLLPQRMAQLTWLGLSSGTVQALQPYVTVLPAATPVNLNTAPAEVLAAVVPTLGRDGAQQAVAARARNPFSSTADAATRLGVENIDANTLAVASSYFEIYGRLRLGDITVVEHSLVNRSGSTVITLWRERTAANPSSPVPQ
jgi:general secretion pathway protein K